MMQNKIKLLSEQTINKIAAGEVIENPASVVKELVENSIDAGATSISIEIQQGGRHLMRITDNGCGMSADDALLCLQRHATSKIVEVEDIQELFTMGFRGEAIPSIASISKFMLLTNAFEDQSAAILLKVEAGKIISSNDAVRTRGTTIEVKDLFFNIPVRQKFQKSPNFDIQAILKVTSLLALSHPTIHFHLISDQKCLIKTPLISDSSFSHQLSNRIETILGKEIMQELSPIHFHQAPFQLEGFLGLPALHKANKSNQYLFINQRAVSSTLVSAAIREGYGPMLPMHRHPVFILHLNLPGSLIDVNVHPQKKEVRLRQEQQLKEHLINAVQSALQRRSSAMNHCSYLDSNDIPPFFSKKSETDTVQEHKWEYLPILENDQVPLPSFSNEAMKETPIKQDETQDFPIFAVRESNPQVLYTFKGYMVVDGQNPKLKSLFSDQKDGICLVSQKNAYTRLLYERLITQTSLQFGVQSLLIPITVNLSSIESLTVKNYLDQLNIMGFSIREFGDHTFLIDAYPEFLEERDLADCLHQIVQDLLETQESNKLKSIQEEQFAWIACKGSLTSNKRLSIYEAQLLVDQLFKIENPFQCPKGNAIFTYLSQDLLKQFFEK